MKTFNTISSIREEIKRIKKKNLKIGFVPTMGALHDGHLSLLKKARKENDVVVLSIFVNKIQFGPAEDFSRYPRDYKKDKLLAQKEKVDIIFYPSGQIMYTEGYLTYVSVNDISSVLCGKSRPGHFRGVTTVVCKLLNIVNPDNIYLGQKDAQQVIVLKKMIMDLNIPVKVNVCPIFREKDGLAMSSRNVYLTGIERKQAVILNKSLKLAGGKIKSGERDPLKIVKLIKNNILKNSSGIIDYVECVDAGTLKSFKNKICGKVLLAVAVKFSQTRLIDNLTIKVK